MEEEIAVLVTNNSRGIYFGFATDRYANPITLKRAKHCYYYPEETKGTYGLAINGPMPGAKCSPELQELIIHNVANIAVCSDKAMDNWTRCEWGTHHAN